MEKKGVVRIGLSVLFWYASSMSITALNKYLFDVLGINIPLLVTFVHFTFMTVLVRVGFSVLPFFPPFPEIDTKDYFKFIVPISLLGAMEIGLSNVSYRMVSLSVMTVIKSSLVVVTYIFAVAFGVEKFSKRLLAIVLCICGAISLAVPGMEIKDPRGIVLLVIAVFGAGLRWVFIHQQLRSKHFTPIQLMLLTQPLASIFLAPFAVVIDMKMLVEQTLDNIDPPKVYSAVIIISTSVFLALFLILSEYNLVNVTSSVSLTVAGVGKEAATIAMSHFAFQETFKPRAIVGICN
eukprot:GHVP01040794.1.p1 GENE.GHVP01040794.1~~GHVP01040794.1.p1  ORF type:complete len:293 (+),score=24.48 GHVP01040794.1:82-960(+)